MALKLHNVLCKAEPCWKKALSGQMGPQHPERPCCFFDGCLPGQTLYKWTHFVLILFLCLHVCACTCSRVRQAGKTSK